MSHRIWYTHYEQKFFIKIYQTIEKKNFTSNFKKIYKNRAKKQFVKNWKNWKNKRILLSSFDNFDKQREN